MLDVLPYIAIGVLVGAPLLLLFDAAFSAHKPWYREYRRREIEEIVERNRLPFPWHTDKR